MGKTTTTSANITRALLWIAAAVAGAATPKSKTLGLGSEAQSKLVSGTFPMLASDGLELGSSALGSPSQGRRGYSLRIVSSPHRTVATRALHGAVRMNSRSMRA